MFPMVVLLKAEYGTLNWMCQRDGVPPATTNMFQEGLDDGAKLLRQVEQLGLVNASGRKPPTFATLPTELLHQIFSCVATAEPTYQFDPSIQPGAPNPWFQVLRTKKALPLICHASFWSGMSVLYNDIVLQRMGQVSTLAETLRTGHLGPSLGKQIKSIRWDSCIVGAPYSSVIHEDLKFIFGQCTVLQSFSYHPHYNFYMQCTPDDDQCEGFFNPMWFIMTPSTVLDPPLLQIVAPSLHFLDIIMVQDRDGVLLPVRAIHRLLSSLPVLESLTLGLPTDDSVELMNLPVVSLPFLTRLWVSADPLLMDEYMCSCWELPQLAHLTLLDYDGWPQHFLKRFDFHLRYLHLYPIMDAFLQPTNYVPTLEATSTLSSICPSLKHLIIPRLSGLGSVPFLVNSPTLLHLDLWTCYRDISSGPQSLAPEDCRMFALNPESTVPSLRTVRLILTSKQSKSYEVDFKSDVKHPDWPWICHPDLLPQDSTEVLYHCFAQGWVTQMAVALIPQDLGEITYHGRDIDEERWPVVYEGEMDELCRMQDGECQWNGGETEEWGALSDRTSSCGEWTSDEEEGSDNDSMSNPEADQDRCDSNLEFQVEQLDRTTILTGFRRGRDREAYGHTNIWDHY